MKRTVFRDYYFDKQPPMAFVEQLKQPVHQTKPDYYGKRTMENGEIDARGIYLAQMFPDDPDGLLEVSYKDFARFTEIYGIGGNHYPVTVCKGSTACFEAYTVEITAEGITVTAEDTEGVRRALIYIEDLLRSSEHAYLTPGVVKRVPKIKSRITRCYFSPINRPPKFGDELSDDIDYYPEEYLNRLMHDGTNGVWIYTRFSDLLPSDILTENGKGYEARLKKLNGVVEKCRRYGIGVYVFAIEPYHLSEEQVAKYPDLAGADVFWEGKRTICISSSRAREYCFEQGSRLATLVPNLRGFISITAGERPTSCASMDDYSTCPRCRGEKRGVLLARAVKALCDGFHSVNPTIEVVSWTYGHRTWDPVDIAEYVEHAPTDACLMQNFDDMGVAKQLGEDRLGVDYWLSYAGPSQLFEETAEAANRYQKRLFAKMQVCCSHEIASIPYIPTPGLIFEKYKGAARYHVEGVMQCWYFGNYPSLMSKAAGELSFEESFDNKTTFLEKLAAIFFGRSRAKAVAAAYAAFEEGYIQYPLNVMFSYYGPAHDGVVWELALKPKNFPLARTWQTLDPVDGDRICDSLLTGHTLPEALALFEEICKNWQAGLEKLNALAVCGPEEAEQRSVANCIGILFGSAKNILKFYLLRDRLGRREGDPEAILNEMRQLVMAEQENSRNMIPLCQNDGRLGWHSEGEGYKFFPEKLQDRIEKLETLLQTEFPEVEQRIRDGLSALAYYDGEEDCEGLKTLVMSRTGIENAQWQTVDADTESRFRMACDETHIVMELESREKITFMLCPEYRLMCPDANILLTPEGKATTQPWTWGMYYSLLEPRAKAILEAYRDLKVLPGEGTHLLLTLPIAKIGLDKIRPMKLRIMAGEVSWIQDADGVSTLGKDRVRPSEYGWIL